jgi:hypothetical protein
MANICPGLYNWLIARHLEEPEAAERLQHYLSVADAAVVSRCYPASAKCYLSLEGLPITTVTRTQTRMPFSEYTAATMKHLWEMNRDYRRTYGKAGG